MNGPRMVFLGFGKFARSDKIYALEPLRGGERGDGRRTRVWVEGIAEPIVASRTERTILHDMGQDAAAPSPIVAAQGFQGIDLVSSGELAEAQEHHAQLAGHDVEYLQVGARSPRGRRGRPRTVTSPGCRPS